MSSIYFIDSENVGDSWISLLDDDESRFIVFYTGHSPRIAYSEIIKIMNAENKPEFINCYEGNNGLDFQLVSYLGYELYADSTNEMIIISNDTGFDTVIKFWNDKGMNVKRIPLSNALKSKNEKKEKTKTEDSSKAESGAKTAESLSGVDRRELYTILNCVGPEDTSNIHMALTHFYGNKNGDSIYKNLKKDNFKAPPVQWTADTKIKKFVELILKYENKEKVSLPDTFATYMAKNISEDRKNMAEKLSRSFGENGVKINKVLKPYYKMLAKIKKDDELPF